MNGCLASNAAKIKARSTTSLPPSRHMAGPHFSRLQFYFICLILYPYERRIPFSPASPILFNSIKLKNGIHHFYHAWSLRVTIVVLDAGRFITTP